MTIIQFIGIGALAIALWSFTTALRRGYFPLEGNDGFWDDDDVEEEPKVYRLERPLAFWWHTTSWSLLCAVIGLICLFAEK